MKKKQRFTGRKVLGFLILVVAVILFVRQITTASLLMPTDPWERDYDGSSGSTGETRARFTAISVFCLLLLGAGLYFLLKG